MKHLLARLVGALVLGIALLPAVTLAATAPHEDQSMAVVKARLGVPAAAASCHTALIGGYVIEGDVPVEDIRRLLAEHPDVHGLEAPGMPMGSPGTEMGAPERYDVLLIGRDGSSRAFASHGPRA